MPQYTRKSARRSIFHTASLRALSQIATVLGYVVMVRGMSEHDFGVFNLLYAFIPVVSTMASFGLEQTLKRYQPEYLRAENWAAAAWLVNFIRRARFASNVAVLTIILLTWNVMAPLFQLAPYRPTFEIFCLLILFHFQSRILQLSLASHMLHIYSVGMTLILSVGKLCAYTGLLLTHEFSLRNAIFADTAAYALTFVFLWLPHRILCSPPPSAEKFKLPATERKRLLRYGLVNNFNDVGTMVLGVQSDNFFIAAFLNAVAVGAYSFYTRIREMVGRILPTAMFDNVIQPMFFAIPKAQASIRVPRYFSFLLDTALLVQAPVLAYSLAYHTEIVQVIFGGKFIDHAVLLPLILGFATLNIIASPVTLVAQYEEKALAILYSKIFVIYNIATMLILAPLWGIYGAALSTGSAGFLKNLYIWWSVRRFAVWNNAVRAIAMAVAIWGAFVAACFAARALLHPPAMVNLGIGVLLGVAAVFIHIRSAGLSVSDREVLASILHGREARVLHWLGIYPISKANEQD
jgi:O-antigen/teichoic acid export membrane protein